MPVLWPKRISTMQDCANPKRNDTLRLKVFQCDKKNLFIGKFDIRETILSFSFNINGKHFDVFHIKTNVTLISVADILTNIIRVTPDIKSLNIFIPLNKLSSLFDAPRFYLINY